MYLNLMNILQKTLNYSEDSNEGYFLKVDVKYSETLHELDNDLPFLTETIKVEKFEKIVANLFNRKEDVNQIRNLKQASNYRLGLKKVYRVIKFNQKVLFKPYIDMSTELKKIAKNNFEKGFFKPLNN